MRVSSWEWTSEDDPILTSDHSDEDNSPGDRLPRRISITSQFDYGFNDPLHRPRIHAYDAYDASALRLAL